MERKTLLIAIFPSIIMNILTLIIFSSFLNCGILSLDKALGISLGIVIPLLFLIQGILCGMTNTNVYRSFAISTVGFSYIAIIYLDKSASLGLLGYLTVGYIAYLITSAIKRILDLRCCRNIKDN